MPSQLELLPPPRSRARVVPRDYQVAAHDETIRLHDAGIRGTLIRSATGTGKTILAGLIADTWLNHGPKRHVMIISYEQHLVEQFAEEIEDTLGIKPGIEMAEMALRASCIPKIVVASRQTLMVARAPTEDEIAALRSYGIDDPGCAPHRIVKQWLKLLKNGHAEADEIRSEILRINGEPEAQEGRWARLHKFDWRLDWLLIFDEAHKYSLKHATTGPLIEWFDRNPTSRRIGLTATPKRYDGVSIGDKLFPGIALDYPLCKPGHACAVADGWAVPYIQRYIRVEGVDFAGLKRIGSDFDDAELERVLAEEKQLARLVDPLLDMVENRQTLIFSPTIHMAREVSRYINARSRCVCTCGLVKWHPTLLIGDGAACPQCGRLSRPEDIDRSPDQAKSLWGETPRSERRNIYEEHQRGKFQFLSVVGLCKEGYNDPNVACIAIFRPISAAASSLAEQMKGRGCRPLRGCVQTNMTREERLSAIAASDKPNCLIVDLVGCTGLADCASTVEIYADGLPDSIVTRAKDLLAAKGLGEDADVADAIEQARREDIESREKAKQQRLEAERCARDLAEKRAKAEAMVDYSVHEQGVAPCAPQSMTDRQRVLIHLYGMDLGEVHLTKKQAGRIIHQLLGGTNPEEVARTNHIDPGRWSAAKPSNRQQWVLRQVGADWVKTPHQAGLVISAMRDPGRFRDDMVRAMSAANSDAQLTAVACDLRDVMRTVPNLSKEIKAFLVDFGRRKRAQMMSAAKF